MTKTNVRAKATAITEDAMLMIRKIFPFPVLGVVLLSDIALVLFGTSVETVLSEEVSSVDVFSCSFEQGFSSHRVPNDLPQLLHMEETSE